MDWRLFLFWMSACAVGWALRGIYDRKQLRRREVQRRLTEWVG